MKKLFQISLKCANIVCIAFFAVLLIVHIFRLLGFVPYIVVSGSMEPKIHVGSLCIVNTKYKYDDIIEGDIIAYESVNGRLVTHRVIGIEESGFETKGDNNVLSDGITTTIKNFVGKTIFSVPKFGYLFQYIQSAHGKIACITWAVSIFLLNRLEDMKV